MENSFFKILTTGALGVLLSFSVFAAKDVSHEKEDASHQEGTGLQAGKKQDKHDERDEEKGQTIRLSKAQMEMAGIESAPLSLNSIVTEIHAPGEIRLHAYRTAKVTPRISAQIIGRDVKLGDAVKKGQPMAVLSSVELVEAQGELLVASKEWRRVENLGKKILSDQRYTEAKIAFDQAYAKVLAYGMTTDQVHDLLNSDHARRTGGTFQLLAPMNGTVIKDEFILGELIEPGRVLFEISDESILWVEARVFPEDGQKIVIGSQARVKAGKAIVSGKVVQIQHALDETTRTLGVRIEIPNAGDQLHPGMFVDVGINGNDQSMALTLPKEAVLRSPDGDFVIFVETEPGEFQAKEIKVVRSEGELLIIDGVQPGQSVVRKGAFFVQSELAKSGFQAHNH